MSELDGRPPILFPLETRLNSTVRDLTRCRTKWPPHLRECRRETNPENGRLRRAVRPVCARLPIGLPYAAWYARLRGFGCCDARADHWHEHRGLQRVQRRPPPAALL